MINRRMALGLAITAAATTFVAVGATAQPKDVFTTFETKAFEAAQAAGKPIVVEIHAPWCPVCKVQAPIIQGLAGKPEFKDLVVFRIDFDTKKEFVRLFKATRQSTLIAFKGKTESGRLVGDTQPDAIEKLLKTAI
jgi:thiol-disulfide isomerase/thioredoxin